MIRRLNFIDFVLLTAVKFYTYDMILENPMTSTSAMGDAMLES